jgi:signal peptidase II
MRRYGWVFGIVGLLLADRLTKLWAAHALPAGMPQPLIGNAIRLTRVYNAGGAFGLFPGSGALFIAVSAVAATVILCVLLFARAQTKLLQAGLSLVFVGAVGNLIDRALNGYVLDFFEIRGFPIFNVADACITIGAGLIVLYALFGGERHRPQREADRS